MFWLSAIPFIKSMQTKWRATLSLFRMYCFCLNCVTLKLPFHAVLRTVFSDKEDGSFAGDQWGEVDTRFSFSALSALAILKRLDQVDVNKACLYVSKCKNFDGGFGFKGNHGMWCSNVCLVSRSFLCVCVSCLPNKWKVNLMVLPFLLAWARWRLEKLFTTATKTC
jgi:hypothetical protein